MDQLSTIQFLVVLLATIRGDEKLFDAAQTLGDLVKAGMRIVLIFETELDVV